VNNVILLLLFYLLFLTVILLWQMRSLKGRKKEMIVFSILMGLGAVLGSLMILGIPIPSPTQPLRYVFEPLGKMLLGG
jgi:putative effector of murein hydrolase